MDLVQKMKEYIAGQAAERDWTEPSIEGIGAQFVRDGKWQLNNMAKQINEDPMGFAMRFGALPLTVAGPGAAGFEAAQSAGKVFDGAVDRIPRFEISDELANFDHKGIPINANSATLGDILDHPELYDNYPALQDMKVVVDSRMDPNTHGVFNQDWDVGNGAIKLNPKIASDYERGKSVLLHEVQHAIQEHEGMATGGSKEYAIDAYLDQLKSQFNNLMQNSDGTMKSLRPGQRLPRPAAAVKSQIQAIESGKVRPFDLYQRLAGEAEARNVSNRMNWNDRLRSEIPFNESFDVPPSQQIYLNKK